MSKSIDSERSWKSGWLAGVLVALALSSLACAAKILSEVRPRTQQENLELAVACDWDAATDHLQACPLFEDWLREADAACVQEE